MDLKEILHNLPEVENPGGKKLSFNDKLKWTLVVLVSFFVLSDILLYGADSGFLDKFRYLAVIMGTNFGSIISLGIGPIVMASIILQLLVGAKILDIDTSTDEGKKFFQGLQKLLVFFFVIFEALVYVLMGGIRARPGLEGLVILQLILGGLIIVFLDELCNKWGLGSGVSLFIAAGVGKRLFITLFGFLGTEGINIGSNASGQVWVFLNSIIGANPKGAMLALAAILSTTIVFLGVVWAQSLKIEIPLSYDRIRGYTLKWPLKFFYASVIPVILVSALIANLQLFGGILQKWLGHPTFLGNVVNGRADSGMLYWVSAPYPSLVSSIISGGWSWTLIPRSIVHIFFYMILAAVFSYFWVKTSGMDASSQAENILKSGLQIPGFRKDKRILESILSRYVLSLTIMGGLAIGLLASLANVLGTLVRGTSILLGIMIVFQFYEQIAKEHQVDMNPAMKKIMGM